MSHCVSNWNMEENLLSVGQQKKSLGADQELVELLWRNGQVVLQSRTNRKPCLIANDSKQVQKTDQSILKVPGSFGNSSCLIQEDETASWIQYPLEDSLEKEFSDFFYEFPPTNPSEVYKPVKLFEADKYVKLGVAEENSALRSQQPVFKKSNDPSLSEIPMPPPILQVPASNQQDPNLGEIGRIVNFSHFSKPIQANLGSSKGLTGEQGKENVTRGQVGDSSAMTIGSSHCSSNHIANEVNLSRFSSNGVGATRVLPGPVKGDVRKVFTQSESARIGPLEPTVTSSSGGSGSSFGRAGKQSTSTPSKRKGRDADESECQSEEAEFESAEANKPVQRTGSSRRSRAAEVHNLSERRRRDRINEKMRALQELIPHCNKSDKASMLDEAIEYLKSLQLQLQIMWMGSGMAPMMFPGVQHYMSRMGMGMGPPSLLSIPSPMQLPRIPIVDQAISVSPTPNQSVMCPPAVLNPINFQNQMQNSNFPDQYACYMGFQHMQTAPQQMNMFGYGSQLAPQGHKMVPPITGGEPCNGGVPINITQSSKLG